MRKGAVAGPACRSLIKLWDAVVSEFLTGRSVLSPDLEQWTRSYHGKGRGRVERSAMPEPFLGPLRRPRGVFLALNPGRADLSFQGRNGVFADEIRAAGSYSTWAASWPYLRDPWVPAKGVNRHHATRLQFLRTWFGEPNLSQELMVSFELYPWHSTAVTGAMRPPKAIIDGYVWKPVAELKAPVFAFGAPWLHILEKELGLEVVDRLGAGGRDYGSTVASRSVTVLKSEHGVTVVAEKHRGGAGPPSRAETDLLRDALDRWL